MCAQKHANAAARKPSDPDVVMEAATSAIAKVLAEESDSGADQMSDSSDMSTTAPLNRAQHH